MRYAQTVAYLCGIVYILGAAAWMMRLYLYLRLCLTYEAHGYPEDLVTLPEQQGSSYGGVHPTTHSYGDTAL